MSKENKVVVKMKQYIPLPPHSKEAEELSTIVESARPGAPDSFVDVAYLFLFSLQSRGSPRSVKAYRPALHHLAGYLNSVKKDPLSTNIKELSTKDIVECIKGISNGTGKWPGAPKMIGTATKRQYVASMKLFTNWLIDEDHWDSQVDLKFDRQMKGLAKGVNPKNKRTPEEEDIKAVITAARNLEIDPELTGWRLEQSRLAKLRDIAAFEMLRSSGMRVSELCSLTRGDLDRKKQSAWVVGKGNKERLVFFDKVAWVSLEEYLNTRGDGEKGRELSKIPVLVSHSIRGSLSGAKPLSIITIQRAVEKYATIAGVTHMTAHSFRHYFATYVSGKDVDLAAVQALLGHASPATTMRYVKINDKQKKRAHEKAFGSSEGSV